MTAHEHTLKQDENIKSKVQEVRGKNLSRAKYASLLKYVWLFIWAIMFPKLWYIVSRLFDILSVLVTCMSKRVLAVEEQASLQTAAVTRDLY